MSNQREDFDSIYASIDDDDDDYVEEMYVDVTSSTPPQTSTLTGPSPYVYPSSPQPPSLSVRKLPPLPPKSTVGATSKPPWPRAAPKPPSNEASYKAVTSVKSSDPKRNIPCPLPRTGTVKKKEGVSVDRSKGAEPQSNNTKTGGYHPPPSVHKQGANQGNNYAKRNAANKQDTNLAPNINSQEELHTQHGYAKGMHLPGHKKLPYPAPPPDSAPPPPPPNSTTYGEEIYDDGSSLPPVSDYTLNNSPTVGDEYELLRPANTRLKRGYGQRSRRSRRYSSDNIPLQDMSGDNDERLGESGRKRRKGRKKEGAEDTQNKSDNSKAVCILLTIIVVALLISLMSLALSLYTLTRFELYIRLNDTVTECDVRVTNCTTDVSSIECTSSSDSDGNTSVSTCSPKIGSGSQVQLHCDIAEATCN